MERAPSKCIYCGRTERSLLIRIGDWTVQKCSGCGLGVLDPRPDAKELGALYKESYFVSEYESPLEAGSRGMERRIRQEMHRIRFLRKRKLKGLVLDMGCGRGYFLHACQLSGYDVVGLDVSEDAAAYVRDTLGIPVRTGPVEEDLFQPESIDVITMWHSLEHVTDPRRYLDCVWKWLRPDGVLVVEVPNHEGTDARKMGTEWAGWKLPYHLYHFTPSVLAALLREQGFEPVASNNYHSDFVKARLRRIPVLGLFARLIAKLFLGTAFAVLARKTPRPDAALIVVPTR